MTDLQPAEGRLYWWIAAPLGLALLAGSACLLLFMLLTVIGPFNLQVVPSVAASERVGIWVPGAEAWELEPLRERWSQVFGSLSEIVMERDLEALLARSPSLVVAPGAERMSAADQVALFGYVSAGGAAVLNSAPTESDGANASVSTLVGEESFEWLDRERSYFVAAGARGPLLAGIDPGRRIGLAPGERVPALDREASELFWSQWRIAPVASASGASARREPGRGRLVWLAIEPRDVPEGGGEVVDQLYRNAGHWARRRPVGELLPWPDAAPFAALLAMDTEDRFENSRAVAELAERVEFPVTFLVLTQFAPEYPDLIRRLAEAGEVGTHGDVHTGFEGEPREDQTRRLRAALGDVYRLGLHPVGFRPPLESYDSNTMRAMLEVGYEYLLGDLAFDRQVPRIVSPDPGGPALVQIPRTGADDVEIYGRESGPSIEELRNAVFADLEEVSRGGGLYYFSFHTQHFGGSQPIELLEDLMEAVRERRGWAQTAGEIARWWRLRDAVATDLTAVGPQRVGVSATNEGSQPVRGVSVRVYPNRPFRNPSASASTVFGRSPRVVWEPGDHHVDLVLPPMAPGSSTQVMLDYERID